MKALSGAGLELTLIVAGALCLIFAARFGRFVLEVSSVARGRRDLLARVGPLLLLALTLGYLIFLVRVLFAGEASIRSAALALVFAGFAAVSWPALRDLTSGVYARATRLTRVGDSVRIGELSGRVERLGLLSITIETPQGDEALVPYGRLLGDTLVRTSSAEGTSLHVFRVELDPSLAPALAKARIRQAAMLCHWSSVAREADVQRLEDGRYEVTVSVIDSDHTREIEESVRASLGSAARASRAPGPRSLGIGSGPRSI